MKLGELSCGCEWVGFISCLLPTEEMRIPDSFPFTRWDLMYGAAQRVLCRSSRDTLQ